MLRIVFVTNSLACGGAENHAVTLMNRLVELGHDCHAVRVKRESTLIGRLRLRRGATICDLGATRYLDFGAIRRLAELIASLCPVLIVAANPYALLYASLARALTRVRTPLVAVLHSSRPREPRERLKLLLERPCFWFAACTVFVCREQMRYWLPRAVRSRRNNVIYNGIDTHEFRPGACAQRRASIRARFGLERSDYVIGVVAGLRREKNHVQLIEAVRQLRERGIAARALLIGEGEMRPAIEARARELGVSAHVVLAGFQDDIRPLVTACDVTALCSLTEAMPLAALESMALARPVVHSDVGGAAEIILPGVNGFLFPPGDTAALVDRLERLADRELAARMSRNARKVVAKGFSESEMVERYERLFLTLAYAPRSRGALGEHA
ncbi:MAG TPA: glycosyltransferase [Steroidobacteraceae bacterium]|nr:glycosyltransferase [Steroidobacteraceae bacterium]